MKKESAAFKRIAGLLAHKEVGRTPAVLLVSQPNIYYFTNFTGHDSWALVTAKRIFLFTDGRYTLQARQEAPQARIFVRRGPMVPFFTDALARTSIRTIGFLAEEMSVAVLDRLRRTRRHIRYHKLSSQPVRQLRQIKTPAEVTQIRRALAIAQRAYLELQADLAPGLTEKQVAADLEYRMRRLGADKAAFDIILAGGPNGAKPHARPSDSPLASGKPVVIDFGARLGEYSCDLTRTVCLGKMPPYFKDMYRVCLAAQQAGIEAIRPGARTNEVDAAARKVITRAGYGRYFNHGLGHGLGLDVHESPTLSKTVEQVLQPGMVVTVEPGIYLPGKAGVRIEDDVLVTDTGREVLSSLPKELDEVLL